VVPANLDELEERFTRDGFVNGGAVLSSEALEQLRRDLERFVDAFFRGRDDGVGRVTYANDLSRVEGLNHYQLCGLWKHSESFRRLIENPAILSIAARLAQSPLLQLWSDTVQYKPAERGAHFAWHQDAPYHQSIEPPQLLLAAWVAFDDAEVDSGCMWMVPGSHRWGIQEPHIWGFRDAAPLEEFRRIAPPADAPHIAEAWREPVPCPVKAGEVHFHHALTWHGSPTNQSRRARRGYTMHYMPAGVRLACEDNRAPMPIGTPMVEAGPEFPIVYRGQSAPEQ